jgi:hypothetical protein
MAVKEKFFYDCRTAAGRLSFVPLVNFFMVMKKSSVILLKRILKVGLKVKFVILLKRY